MGALAQGVAELFLVEEQYRPAMDSAESAYVTALIDRITGWGPMWAQFHGAAATARA